VQIAIATPWDSKRFKGAAASRLQGGAAERSAVWIISSEDEQKVYGSLP